MNTMPMKTQMMTMHTPTNFLLAACAAAMMSACTTIPEQLQGEYDNVSPARVDAREFGRNVRWGGVLIDTRNEEEKTCFEVLSRDLDRYMRPETSDTTAGRFIACTTGFYDPEVYAKGREVTVTGQIQSLEERKIEEFDYRYPVLAVEDLVLWQKRQNVLVYNQVYSPFYYPYYWGGAWGGYYPYYRYRYPYAGYGPGFGGGYMYMRQTEPGPSQTITDDP